MILRASFLVAPLLMLSASATAQVIVYDSVSGGFESNLSVGHPFDGSMVGGGYKEIASPFSPSQTILLQSISVVAGVTNGPGNAKISLYADEGNSPGNLLESWVIGSMTNTATLFEVHSNSNVQLNIGSQYWVSVAALFDITDGTWCPSNSMGNGRLALRLESGGSFSSYPTGPFGTLIINGSAVPEPSTIFLLGFLPMILRRRAK